MRTPISEGLLFTDLYQLTMAQLYFQNGLHSKKVQFEFNFRSYPDYGGHQAGYCINAGLQSFVSWMKSARLNEDGVECLKNQRSTTGGPLFANDFLEWLREQSLFHNFTLRAICEGRAVHPLEPIISVQGDLALCQIIESSLLNHLNYQILIATKASRIRSAGGERPLIEFGMRRAHSLGANAGTRAALIGGADFSSNTGMSCTLGYPPKGTHAHSMVQLFMVLGEGELGAFRAYAQAYPDDCLLLVDTINTLESGVPNAIKVFEELRAKGHKPVGIRLDSGDLAFLAIQSAIMLDKAGFETASIVLSNDIDEMVLFQVLRQIREEALRYGADYQKVINRLVYGVGTRLITSQGKGALDGVYKLTAVFHQNNWIPSIKISETSQKTITPGCKQVWRIYDMQGMANADLICLWNEDPGEKENLLLRHPLKSELFRTLHNRDVSSMEPMLGDIIKDGKLVFQFPPLEKLRKNRDDDLKRLDLGVKRMINPHIYHVSLSERLWKLKQNLIEKNSPVVR